MDWLVVIFVTLAVGSMVNRQWILGAGFAMALGMLEWARLKSPEVEDQLIRIEQPRWRNWFLRTWAASAALLALVFVVAGDDSLVADVAGAIVGGAFLSALVMWIIWTHT
jgi:hypothetical protein